MNARIPTTPIHVCKPALSFLVAVVAATAASGLGCGIQEHRKGSSSPIVVGPGTTLGTGGAAFVPEGQTGGSAPVGSTGGSNGNGSGSGGAGLSIGSGTGGRVASGTGTGGVVGQASGGRGTGTSFGGGPPLSGITINIAGTMVPKEKAIVFIHWGHSNMMGHAETPPELRPFFYDTQPGLWIFRGGTTFVPAMEPTAPSMPRDRGAGPGMALLRTAAAASPPDYHFISIGRGEGSAPSTDYAQGGLLYKAVMDRAVSLKGKVTFGGIFVMMGITERHLPAAQQPGFPMRVQQIIAAMRADLGEPNLPVLHTDYEMEANMTLAPDGPIGMAVRPLIQMLPGLIPNLKIVPTEGCTVEDDHHFTFIGQKLWSERALDLLKKDGKLPWVP